MSAPSFYIALHPIFLCEGRINRRLFNPEFIFFSYHVIRKETTVCSES